MQLFKVQMRTSLLLIVGFLFLSTAFGQDKIENKLTGEHINVSGTKVSLIPPRGFVKAPNFLGFQQTESGSTIMILDIPGPFSETSKGLTKEGLLSKGIEIKEIQKMTLNNLPAILAIGEQNAYGNVYTKYVMAFGSDKETILLNGACPKNLEEIGKLIKASILTAVYDADKKINPFETVDFELDVSKSKLRFAKSMSNSLIFTADGELPTKSEDKITLIATKSFTEIDIQDKKLFALNRLKQMPIELEKIQATTEITIDGVSGYEMIASAKDKKTGDSEKIYQVILFSDKLYYLLFGSTNDKSEKNINELKQVVRTFKRK